MSRSGCPQWTGPRSPSSRRAWIEIFSIVPQAARTAVALLAEGVDRNDLVDVLAEQDTASPSSRRAWIEISARQHCSASRRVALLAEGVDRN